MKKLNKNNQKKQNKKMKIQMKKLKMNKKIDLYINQLLINI